MAQCISHIEKSASADWRQDGVLRNKFAEGYAMLLSLVKIRKYMPEYLHIPNILLPPVINCITVYYKTVHIYLPEQNE